MKSHLRPVLLVLVLALLAGSGVHAARVAAQTPPAGTTTLPGYVLPVLQSATKVTHPVADAATIAQQKIDISIVLQRTDEAGFQSYLKDIQDPKSANFGHYLSQADLASRFGPSQQAYDAVSSFLTSAGFSIVQGSANRLTITAQGTRAQAAQAFATPLSDYSLNGVSFYANESNPAVPSALAPEIRGVAGLNDLARPRPAAGAAPAVNSFPAITPMALSAAYDFAGVANATGAGQKIGLLEFDNYQLSDVQNWATWLGLPAARINQLSRVDVAGGSLASLGGGTDEVMLDIEMVMGMAPGANYVVYDAPNGALPASVGFDALFNTMINDNDTVISNSWQACESQIVPADLTTMDSILAQAAAGGIAVFNSSGDTGNACLTGSGALSGVAAFPADSAFAVAVGGTTLNVNAQSGAYASETYWNYGGTTSGGFWTSAIEPRPAYQNGFASGSYRTGPDVAADAGDGIGIVINGQHLCCYGGTSEATPAWAAGMALIYQQMGHQLGDLNAKLYALAPTNAFHSAASMNSDFTHVGLGSFDLGQLDSGLTGESQCGDASTTPQMVLPAPGATLAGGAQVFCWTYGANTGSYSLEIGTQGPGSGDLYAANALGYAALNTMTVPNIPSQGLILFVRLSWILAANNTDTTQYADYRYLEPAGNGQLDYGLPAGCWEVAAAATTPANTTVMTLVNQVQQTGGAGNPVIGVWRDDPATQNEQAGYIASSGAPVDFSTYGPGNDLDLCVAPGAGQYALLPISGFIPTLAPTHVPFARFYGTASVNGVSAHDFASVDVWSGSSFCGVGTVKSGSYVLDSQDYSGCVTAGATLTFNIDNAAVAQTATVPAVPGGGVPLNLTAGGGSHTLTVNVSGCGSVSPSGNSDQYAGANISLAATACGGGQIFSGWTVNSGGVSCAGGLTVSPCAFTMPNNAVTLTATFSGTTPQITTPAPNSTLCCGAVTFQWTPAAGVSAYWLYVGTSGVGAYNLFTSGPLPASTTSVDVSHLPTFGGTVYVRLWYTVSGAWRSVDYTYTAYTAITTLPLTIGANGCGATDPTGTSQSVPTTAVYVTESPCDSAHTFAGWSVTGASCSNGAMSSPCSFTMPNNAVTVTANFTAIGGGGGGGGGGGSCTLLGTLKAGAPVVSGCTFSGGTLALSWGAVGNGSYFVYLGSSQGKSDLAAVSVNSTSYSKSGLPASGPIYLRLFSSVNGGYPFNDYTVGAGGGTPQLTVSSSGCGSTTPSGSSTPTAGSAVSVSATPCDGNHTFSGWTISGASCTGGLATSPCAFTMPNASVTLTASFSTMGGGCTLIGSATANAPQLTTCTLSGGTLSLTWGAVGSGAYYVYLGTAQGRSDLGAVSVSGTTYSKSGLPASGTIYLRLFSTAGGGYPFNDYSITN